MPGAKMVTFQSLSRRGSPSPRRGIAALCLAAGAAARMRRAGGHRAHRPSGTCLTTLELGGERGAEARLARNLQAMRFDSCRPGNREREDRQSGAAVDNPLPGRRREVGCPHVVHRGRPVGIEHDAERPVRVSDHYRMALRAEAGVELKMLQDTANVPLRIREDRVSDYAREALGDRKATPRAEIRARKADVDCPSLVCGSSARAGMTMVASRQASRIPITRTDFMAILPAAPGSRRQRPPSAPEEPAPDLVKRDRGAPTSAQAFPPCD